MDSRGAEYQKDERHLKTESKNKQKKVLEDKAERRPTSHDRVSHSRKKKAQRNKQERVGKSYWEQTTRAQEKLARTDTI